MEEQDYDIPGQDSKRALAVLQATFSAPQGNLLHQVSYWTCVLLVILSSISSVHICLVFADVNPACNCCWNQPVLSNKCKASCSGKQQAHLKGLELTTDI